MGLIQSIQVLLVLHQVLLILWLIYVRCLRLMSEILTFSHSFSVLPMQNVECVLVGRAQEVYSAIWWPGLWYGEIGLIKSFWVGSWGISPEIKELGKGRYANTWRLLVIWLPVSSLSAHLHRHPPFWFEYVVLIYLCFALHLKGPSHILHSCTAHTTDFTDFHTPCCQHLICQLTLGHFGLIKYC